MAASSSPLLKSSMSRSSPAFHHHVDEVCPLCEQQIPHDQFDEIKGRIESRQKQNSEELTARLAEQFAADMAEALQKAKADAAAETVAAREEGRLNAEGQAAEKIAAAQLANETAQALLQAQVDAAKEAQAAIEQERLSLQQKLSQAASEQAAAIDAVWHEAAAKEADIRTQAQAAADAAAQERLLSAEEAKLAAEAAGAVLQGKLERLTVESDAKIQSIRDEAATREAQIKSEAFVAAETAAQQKIADLEKARLDADAKVAEVVQQIATVKAADEATLNQRLLEQREAFEQDKLVAVNAEKAAAFKETQKLSEKVAELTRALEKKSNEELGEGAEIDLFEALKAEFEGDRIERINKGQPGADVLHTVYHNGKICGTIIYDSKNHNAWRNEFVTKLAVDQMAAKAEHAILSTSKFPAGAHQLHIQDGILIANPARVVALVTVIRKHVVQTHKLRLSSEEKVQKTSALYDFVTSERCNDLFNRIDKHADTLLEIQVSEQKAHNAVWKRQGELIRSVQKVRAELSSEIDVIIGTAGATEQLND